MLYFQITFLNVPMEKDNINKNKISMTVNKSMEIYHHRKL